LSAFASTVKKIPGLRLIIIGGFPEEHRDYYLKTIELIEKENLSEHVRILGYRQDALDILKCMDFFISPSLSEGLPISILEAFAAEIPTIATEITGNKDVVRNSVFGVLAEPDSVESLSQAIAKMVQLEHRDRDILKRNAYNRVKNHFSIEEMVGKTVLLYNQVLKGTPRL
jgi:glycosyltransferase involved in cell wall biosynthesis